MSSRYIHNASLRLTGEPHGSQRVKWICKMFSALSIDKLNNGILDGPQIRKLPKGDDHI